MIDKFGIAILLAVSPIFTEAADFTISEFPTHCTTTEWHEEKSSIFSTIRVPVQQDQIKISRVVMTVDADNATEPQSSTAIQACGNEVFLRQSLTDTPSLGPIPQKNFSDALKTCISKNAPRIKVRLVFYSLEGGCR